MRQKRCLLIALMILLLSLTLVSCSSVSDADLINAGSLLLQYELDVNYGGEINPYWQTGADWQGTPASEGVLEPERIPDWARDQYVTCVYWEDEFHTETTVSRPGPDAVRIRHGRGWGWILMDKDLEFHILETNLQWTITEDGEEVESFNQTFVDAWENPEDDT